MSNKPRNLTVSCGGEMASTNGPTTTESKPTFFFCIALLCAIALSFYISMRGEKRTTTTTVPAATAASVPTCGPGFHGSTYLVTDGSDESDCSAGGGNYTVLCVCAGNWSALKAEQATAATTEKASQ